MTLEEQLIYHEGIRYHAYRDTVGKLTIGCGRNLDDVGITPDEALYLLRNDIARVQEELTRTFPWFVTLSEIRARVLVDMCFNLGLAGLKTFRATLASLVAGDYVNAARLMLSSKWARQVGTRATRLAYMMEHNAEPTYVVTNP